ncbi:MAG: nickel pincer cofactor biosynthesis protein LarC [Candidatus Hodarchaeota archaeon]
MKTLYIDMSNSGISGDMFLASLLDMIPNSIDVLNQLKQLKNYVKGVKKLELVLEKVKRTGIMVSHLKIDIEENKTERSAKNLKASLQTYLNENEYSELAKKYALNVLETLLQVEAEVHNSSVSDIHLHELSSVDTLVDILGVTKSLDELGYFKEDFNVYCSKIPLGAGTIKTAHGVLAIPAPATIKMLENTDLLIQSGPIENELATPTGVALLVNLKPKYLIYSDAMSLNKVAYSTGAKEFKDFSNILRIFYGDIKSQTIQNHFKKYFEDITVLETDVDDVSGELLGNLVKILENEQVLDIQIIPSITKKNRPSHIIKVLCHPENSFELIETILKELGTLGVRFNTIRRVCIDREIIKAKIQAQEKTYDVSYKISYYMTDEYKKIVNIKPEYEDLKKISVETGIPVKELLIYAQEKLKTLSEEFKTEL